MTAKRPLPRSVFLARRPKPARRPQIIAQLSAALHDMVQPLHALSLHLSALEKRIENKQAQAMLDKAGLSADALRARVGLMSDLLRVHAEPARPWRKVDVKALLEELAAENAGLRADPRMPDLVIFSDPALVETALRHAAHYALGRSARAHAAIVLDNKSFQILVGPGTSERPTTPLADCAGPAGLAPEIALVRLVAKRLGMRLLLGFDDDGIVRLALAGARSA